MAGALRKTMLYLGLADDQGQHDEYEYEDYTPEVEVPVREQREIEYPAEVTPIRRNLVREALPAPSD